MSSDHETPPRQVRDLLDFVLLYDSDRAQSRVRALDEYVGLFPHSRAAIEAEYHRLSTLARSSPAQSGSSGPQAIGHYIIERELGRGGQGRVYLAFDPDMRRRVALKVLSSGRLAPDRLRRFRREVEIIAKLDHQGLCAVYDADLDGPIPYLVMRYIEGSDLASKIKAAREAQSDSDWLRPRTPIAFSRAIHVVERAARALHSAHEAGVLHRDVKPANILVRDDGEPVLVDFGLARGDDSEFQSITATDDQFGTPAYMAPELIESGEGIVDRRADVYALGVTLYECLTLERPFQSPTRASVFQRITEGQYTDPRRLNPSIGPELAVVIATAIERDPARRYSTALDLAEDLRRVREYEPVHARRASWFLRGRRWAQRHPRLATAIGLLAACLTGWIVTLSVMLDRLKASTLDLSRSNERLRGVEYRERSRAELRSNTGFALALALEAESRDAGLESNMAILRALEELREERAFSLRSLVFDDTPIALDVSSNSRYIGVVSAKGCAAIYDIAAGRWVGYPHALRGSTSRVNPPARMLADGSGVLVSPGSGPIALVDCATGALRRRFDVPPLPVRSLELSRDGRSMLIGQIGGGEFPNRATPVCIFDVDTGERIRVFVTDFLCTGVARFDDSGRQVLLTSGAHASADGCGSDSSDIQIWGVSSAAPQLTVRSDAPVRDAAFGPGGHYFVAADRGGLVKAWSTESGAERWSAAMPAVAWSLAVAPDGRSVAIGHDEGVRVLDADTGVLRFDLEGLRGRGVHHVRFSPDGLWIAAQDYGGAVGAWRVTDGEPQLLARSEGTRQGALAWFPDSRRFVSCSGGTARVWTLAPISGLLRTEGHTGPVSTLTWDGVSRTILSAGDDGTLRISSIDTGAEEWRFDLEQGRLVRAWYMGIDGLTIGCLTEHGDIFTIDRHTSRTSLVRAGTNGRVSTSDVGPRGTSVALGHETGAFAWIALPDGDVVAQDAKARERVNSIKVSPSGARVAWGSRDGFLGCAEMQTRRVDVRTPSNDQSGDQQIYSVGFSGDEAHVFASGDWRGARIWRTSDFAYEGEIDLRSFADIVVEKNTGNLVAVARWAARLWKFEFRLVARSMTLAGWSDSSGSNTRTRGVMRTLWEAGDAADGLFTVVRLSPDERLILTGCKEGVAQLWNCGDGTPHLRFEHGSAPITAAEFSPNGLHVATAAEDGSIRIWPVDVRALAERQRPGDLDVWVDRRRESR